MRKGEVMRVALVCLLGCAAGAPGRDVPVYREYTRPILFYDETGVQAGIEGGAPDLRALRALRDSQAQETMMGKETMLDLAFGSGGSVFGKPAPLSGKMSAASGDGDDVRRRKDESGRNWLAKSLALPSLGQTSSNAALTAMSASEGESRWGWLADEVADRAEVAEDALPEPEKFNPMAAQEAALSGGIPAADSARKESAPATDEDKAAANPFPARVDPGQKPSDRAADRPAPTGRDPAGGGSAAMQSYRAPSAVAEMTQTRQMLSEFAGVARPDFVSLRESPGLSAGAAPGGAERAAADRPARDFSSLPGGAPGGSAWNNPFSSGSGSAAGGGSPGISSWQGGWSAQGAGGGSPSRFGLSADPVPAAVSPASARAAPRPGVSSGGAKPGWY